MDSGRADRVGGGSATERGRTTSMPGQLSSGGERVDGSSSTRRIQLGSGSAPAPDARAGFRAAGRQAEQGDGSAPYLNRVSIDEARRRGNGNPDNEDDVLMRNDSAPRETTWKGLVSNDIYYIWNHGPKFGGGFDCRYCPLITRGGGATRFREHLGGILGEVRECPNVPRNVCAAMRDSRYDASRKKREKTNRKLRLERDIMEGLYHGEGVINIEEDDDERIQTALRETLRDKNVSRAVERRRGSGSGVRVSLGKQSIIAYFDKELLSNKVSMQPKISTALNVESKDVLGQAWAKFFHANDIAGLKANCPYFRAAIKITQNLGPAPVPTAKEIDGIYLDKNYEEAEQWLKMFKQDWRNYGVTVMCDSWTGPTECRECRGRFGQRLARSSAEKMSPTEWWFQFGGEVPNLQKCALRIVSQCISSSGCERNWSAFALVHTKQRNRLLYGKLHKLVSVRYNLKIRAEEEQDPVRENDKQKEVDACAMMMDTTMFDATNPMMEWLNEDEEHVILDGADAASAVFEQIRFLAQVGKPLILEGRTMAGKGRG